MHKRHVVILILLFLPIIIGIGWLSKILGLFPSTTKYQPIEVYFADNISPSHQYVIDEFNRTYRGKYVVIPVDLPFEKFSTNERKEMLTRSLRSKSEKLDIFAVDCIWVPRFARWCESLDRYFTEDEKHRLLSYAMVSCVFDQKLLAMPMYIDIGLMYYRKDIIRRLPDADVIEHRLEKSITWDDMLHLRKRLGYQNRPFYVYQAKEYEGLVCHLMEITASHDANVARSLTSNLTTEPVVQSLSMLVDFVRTGVSPREVADLEENKSYTYMLDNDAVFVRGWPNFIENFRSFYSDTTKLANIRRAPLPHFKGNRPTSVFGGWNLMVSKSSAHKEAAVEFIRFFESEHIQRKMFERGGYIPIINSIYQDSTYLKTHEELALYYRLLQDGFHRPSFVEYTKVSDIISHYLHLAIKQDISVKDALNQAEAMIRSNAVLIK
jgi:multiple sugar transport system substrate-binding protein